MHTCNCHGDAHAHTHTKQQNEPKTKEVENLHRIWKCVHEWWNTEAHECLNGTKNKWPKPTYGQLCSSAWSPLYFTQIMGKAKAALSVKPRPHHKHMYPVWSGTFSQSWRSDDITRKLWAFSCQTPFQKNKIKSYHNYLKAALMRVSTVKATLIHLSRHSLIIKMSKDYLGPQDDALQYEQSGDFPKIINTDQLKMNMRFWDMGCWDLNIQAPITAGNYILLQV